MYGLYICQPYAEQIITGYKKYEYRNWKSKKLKTPIYLLTKNSECLGIISLRHYQEIDEGPDWYKYAYRVDVIERFEKPRKYFHPLGAVRWVKNVKFT